jgi:peroxiredoxin
MRRARPLIVRPVLALLALAALAVLAPARAVLPAGTMAPDFTLTSLVGANWRLSEQRGKVVVVHFWNAGCGPCREQIALLMQLADKYKASGLVVFGVSIDDEAARALDAVGKMGIMYPVLADRERNVARNYQLKTLPSMVIVDRDGRIRHAYADYRNTLAPAIERQIQELLRL